MITLFTDGSRIANHGAWAFVVSIDGTEFQANGKSDNPDNNYAELQAVIEGLRFIKSVKDGARVIVITDSEFVIHGSKKFPLLWQEYSAISRGLSVTFMLVSDVIKNHKYAHDLAREIL